MFRLATYTVTLSRNVTNQTSKSASTHTQSLRFSSAMSPSLNDMLHHDDYNSSQVTDATTSANVTTQANADDTDTQSKGEFMLILGKPGGGKGTISNKILKDFPMFKHLSTGDLLRQHVRNKTSIGLKAKKHMDNGDLVPDDIMIQLVLHDVNDTSDSEKKSMLLDGFPRTMEQAVAMEESINVDLVVDLNVPVNTIVERISDRWIHPASGRVYNYSYNPPKIEGKDDLTNEDLIQRDDDKPETVRKRLEAYDEVTKPLVQYYANKGILKTFSGTKSDVIYVGVQKWLEEQIHTEKEE
jgi:nucleoside-triphosphate--adenylate kinase